MHIKYLVTLICYPAHIDSHRDFISHVLKYLFFTYTHKRNNATAAFSEIYEHFLKIHMLLTSLSHLNLMCFGIWAIKSLSCVFLADYMPNELWSIWTYILFWLVWFINQRALYNHALSIIGHHPASVLSSVHSSTWHRVIHRYFIFGTHMHICPPYMHIKYLVILTQVFKWQPF